LNALGGRVIPGVNMVEYPSVKGLKHPTVEELLGASITLPEDKEIPPKNDNLVPPGDMFE